MVNHNYPRQTEVEAKAQPLVELSRKAKRETQVVWSIWPPNIRKVSFCTHHPSRSECKTTINIQYSVQLRATYQAGSDALPL